LVARFDERHEEYVETDVEQRLIITGSAHCGRTTGALGLSFRAP